ncbi:MAG: DeoR/GlpR family DNA-binding transcription regulator [Nocardioidaceae bacterium]
MTMGTTRIPGGEARRAAILATIERDEVLRLADAAAELGVSQMTIRRDLKDLEGSGRLRRIRGGAMSVIGPKPFAARRAVRLRAKEVIADKALSLVPRHGAIAMDASSTVGTLATRLRPASGLLVATNSYPTYLALRSTPGVRPILIGGETEEVTESFVGPIAVQAVESLRYTRFFASASALDPQLGVSEVSLSEAEVKRAFQRLSTELVLCVDSSKLGRRSVAAGFALRSVSMLITELPPDDSRLDPYRDQLDIR